MADITIIKRLVAEMEEGFGHLDLAYFTEAIMWWDEALMLSEGIKKEVYHNTIFYTTPKNGNVYLYVGNDLWNCY